MQLSGTLMLPDGSQSVRLSPGTLFVEGGRIIRVEEGACPADCLDTLICPGFTDTHVHLPQFNAIGAHGMQLLDWLDGVIFPAEMAWVDEACAARQAKASLQRLLAHGTTQFVAYATVHHQATRRAIEAAEALGMRGMIGQVLMDMQCPSALSRNTQEQLEETQLLLECWPAALALKAETEKRVSAIVSPRFALSCSEALMKGAACLASEHDAYMQTHLAEMQAECDRALELHGGSSYTHIYERMGMLGPKSLFAHGVYLTQEEQRLIADTNAIIAHCPLANSFLKSGVMNRSDYRQSGMKLTLGSDIGAGYEVSMVRNARAMIETAFYAGTDAASIEHAWWMITAGNAQTLGLERCGIIEEGAEADLLCIVPDIDWRRAAHPLGQLLFSWDDRWLKRVYLRGERLLLDF